MEYQGQIEAETFAFKIAKLRTRQSKHERVQ
jgi:hypothetical protein